MAGQQGTAPLGQPTPSGTTLAPPSTAAMDTNTISQMVSGQINSTAPNPSNDIQGQASQLSNMASARENGGNAQSGKAPGSDPTQATAPNPSTGKAPGGTFGGNTPGGTSGGNTINGVYQPKVTTGNVYLPKTTAQEIASDFQTNPGGAAINSIFGNTYDYGGGGS